MTGVAWGGLRVYDDPFALSSYIWPRADRLRPVHLVPTMGALHAGHRTLIRTAARTNEVPGLSPPRPRDLVPPRVVVSIFVNPRQFRPGEDLDRYPRSFDADLAMCREEGVEIVFAPSVEAMYPPGSGTIVVPGPLGDQLEGASRPGHFAGVLTVVAKLFGIVRPDGAFFGEKDYQQLVLVRRMVRDLRLGVAVHNVRTVRDADGLALSSRNAYLSADQRAAAAALPAALAAGSRAAPHGREAVLAAAGDVLDAQPGVAVDYLALRGGELDPAPARGWAVLLLAATVGTTRLIDNVCLQLGGL